MILKIAKIKDNKDDVDGDILGFCNSYLSWASKFLTSCTSIRIPYTRFDRNIDSLMTHVDTHTVLALNEVVSHAKVGHQVIGEHGTNWIPQKHRSKLQQDRSSRL